MKPDISSAPVAPRTTQCSIDQSLRLVPPGNTTLQLHHPRCHMVPEHPTQLHARPTCSRREAHLFRQFTTAQWWPKQAFTGICSLSELRRRELQVGRAIKLEQLAQMRIAAAEAEVARIDAQIAYEEARSASSNAHSSRLHAGNRDTQAEEQRLPIADSSEVRPTIAPQPTTLLTTAAKAGPSAASCGSIG